MRATIIPPAELEWADTVLKENKAFYYVVGYRDGDDCISDTVAYYRLKVAGDSTQTVYSYFGFPGLKYLELPESNVPEYGTNTDSLAQDILDEQLKCGNIGTSMRAYLNVFPTILNYRNSSLSCEWSGSPWTKWYYDHGFAISNPTGVERNIYLVGALRDCQWSDSIVFSNATHVYFCFPILNCMSLDSLGLVEDGFHGGSTFGASDYIRNMTTFDSAWYNTDVSAWMGSFSTACPGTCYRLYTRYGDWVYIYP